MNSSLVRSTVSPSKTVELHSFITCRCLLTVSILLANTQYSGGVRKNLNQSFSENLIILSSFCIDSICSMFCDKLGPWPVTIAGFPICLSINCPISSLILPPKFSLIVRYYFPYFFIKLLLWRPAEIS